MRTQGINLHVARHCFSSSISSPPSPSLETKNRKRRRLLETIGNASRRISGERLSIETIRRIIDRSVKRKKGRVKREENRMHSRATFVERIPFPRVTLDAPFSTRNSSREREKESFFRGGGRWFMDENREWNRSRDENISSENWSFVGFLSNIRFVCVYVVHFWQFDNVFYLSYFSGTKFIASLLLLWIYRRSIFI